ncbi:unnamed protein product [Cochlearia groenlandica]
MNKILICLLALSFMLLSGLLNTTVARVQYEFPNPRERFWDEKMINEIKAEVGSSCSTPAGGRGPKGQRSSNIPGSPKRCTKP